MNRTNRNHRTVVVLVGLLAIAFAQKASGQDHPPLGHPDFYPSPERPVGFRGDGNGAYPGATPVTEWTEGTPRKVKMPGGWQEYWDLADRKSKNIVWRTSIVGFGNSHPIVVGDRVITTSDPFWLVCLDAHTGQVLWKRASSAFEIMGLDEQDVEELELFVDMAYAARGSIASRVGNYTRLPSSRSGSAMTGRANSGGRARSSRTWRRRTSTPTRCSRP